MEHTEKLYTVMDYINQQVAQWNNFGSEAILEIIITKLEVDPNTLEVYTSEEIKAAERFG